MRAARLAVLPVAVLGATACSGHHVGPDAGRLHVRQIFVPGGGVYTEGSYSYVRIERGGHTVAQVRLSGARIPKAAIQLDPGSYRLISFQRACDGNCHRLDSPTDTCGRAFSMGRKGSLRATVRFSPGNGCRISFS
jgi:hypothetical protein